jgi:hypothetical protein
MEIRSLLFKVLQVGLMILHWVTKDIRHMFSTLTRGLEISVAEGTSNEPHFSTDQILAKVIKLNECLIKTKGTLGTPLFQNNTVMSVDPNLNFIKGNKVYVIQVISEDPDEK